ncbi:MAG: DUF885 domain-containing protein [Pseudomonadota bacterium]
MAFISKLAALFFVLALLQQAAADESFEAIEAEYIALAHAVDPVAAARARGLPPDDWPTVDREELMAHGEKAASLLRRLDQTGDGDAVDRGVVAALLRRMKTQSEHDVARIPFTGDWGFHLAPVFAISQSRLRTPEEADAAIRRIRRIPAYFDANIANLRRGLATGFVAHHDPLANTVRQIRDQIVDDPGDSPLFTPFERLAADDSARRAAARQAVAEAIDAYRDLLRFLETDYAPLARTAPGLRALPGGEAAYRDAARFHTTRRDLSPEEIHGAGLIEVARIRAAMDEVIVESGFGGDFEAFLHFLRTDPQFYADSPGDLIEKASTLSKALDAILPEYFRTLPRLPYGVSPVPAAIAPGYTTARYSQGDPEQGRAGTYLVNTYRLDQRPLYELPALSAHEAVPGHHLQIALAQELEDVAPYRRTYYATAFGEGWALYAERLAGEAGLYKTPYEQFGALSYEMWRACRLVADTGLHWFGWSREEAEACFRKNTALSEHNIQTEVTRYIGWPGQALGYKIGEITILDLRAEAEEALGAAFDIRDFHDVVLAEGATPLDVLERRVRDWIAEQAPNEAGRAP